MNSNAQLRCRKNLFDDCRQARRLHDARDPRCSPLFGDFHTLPPLFVQVSNSECLRDDALRLAPRVRRAGGQLEVEICNGLPHVRQALGLPESSEAIVAIGRFVRARRCVPALAQAASIAAASRPAVARQLYKCGHILAAVAAARPVWANYA